MTARALPGITSVPHAESLVPQAVPIPSLADPLKVLATYGIIWIHAPCSAAGLATTAFARFAVPFFVAISVFFVIHSTLLKPSRTFTEYIQARFRRIYVPFLAWNAIYLTFKWVKWLVASNEPNDFPGSEALVVGVAYHLWFLPFILIISIVFFVIAQTIRRFPTTTLPAALILGVSGWMIALGVDQLAEAALGDGIRYMLQALPAALFAGAFALFYCGGAWRHWMDPTTVFVSLSVFTLCEVISVTRGRITLVECLSGGALLVTACAWRLPARVGGLARLAPYTYGIYLVHLLFLKILETLFHKLAWTPSMALDVTTFFLTALGSTLAVIVLQQTRATRWLVT